MPRIEYQSVIHNATEGAARKLVGLARSTHGDPEGLATAIVEQIIEAATASVFLRLEAEGARRHRLEAVDVLRPHLCGACVELLDPEPEASAWSPVDQGDNMPGSTELAERALFLGWAGQVAELGTHELELSGQETSRMTLIRNIHTSVAARHPLGIAETLAQVISALHAVDDREAQLALEDLAQAELGAAMSEKAEGVLGALRVLVDPDLNEERARESIKTWTLEELVHVEEWAEQAYKAAAAKATTPTKPAVVAALERELDA